MTNTTETAPEGSTDPRQIATETLSKLLDLMGLAAPLQVTENDERITIDMTGENTAVLIGKKGQTLDALQYFVNKIVSRRLGEGVDGKPITLDAEGYRGRRADTLIELAHRVAEKAKKTGRPVELDPMTPADRRTIHMALAEMPGVRTESEGEGLYRHLVVFPTDE